MLFSLDRSRGEKKHPAKSRVTHQKPTARLRWASFWLRGQTLKDKQPIADALEHGAQHSPSPSLYRAPTVHDLGIPQIGPRQRIINVASLVWPSSPPFNHRLEVPSRFGQREGGVERDGSAVRPTFYKHSSYKHSPYRYLLINYRLLKKRLYHSVQKIPALARAFGCSGGDILWSNSCRLIKNSVLPAWGDLRCRFQG